MKDPCRGCRDASDVLARERARALLAEARVAANDGLLAALASESRGMANGMLGWTQALRRDFTSQSAREHALDRMESGIESHLAMLDRLLDASGAPRGEEISLVRLDLREVLESAIAVQRGLADQRDVRVVAPASGSRPVVVLADRSRIARCLDDLLADCMRSAAIGSTIGIEIRTAQASAAVHLTLTGGRVAVAAHRVGVAAASHAARIHGGSLETLEDGFVLRLPFFEPAGVPARASLQKTLLVVREEPEIAEVLAQLAIARGHRVVTVHDEDLAARAIELHDPDVVVVGRVDGLDRVRVLLAARGKSLSKVSSAAEAHALVRDLLPS